MFFSEGAVTNCTDTGMIMVVVLFVTLIGWYIIVLEVLYSGFGQDVTAIATSPEMVCIVVIDGMIQVTRLVGLILTDGAFFPVFGARYTCTGTFGDTESVRNGHVNTADATRYFMTVGISASYNVAWLMRQLDSIASNCAKF